MVSLTHCLESIKSVLTAEEDRDNKRPSINVHMIRNDYKHRRWSLKPATDPESSLPSYYWSKSRRLRG